MRIFNLKRIAYFDELANDPEIDKEIDTSRHLSDWIPAVTSSGEFIPEIGDPAERNRCTLFKHACVYNSEEITIELNQKGYYSSGSGSATDFYFNKKYKMMFFINRQGSGNEILANDIDAVNKIKIWISEWIESPKARDITMPISKILNEKTASVKLAYFEELENDPQVKGAVKTYVLDRFIMGLSTENKKWDPAVINDIWGLRLENKDFVLKVPTRWGRVWCKAGSNEFIIEKYEFSGILTAEDYSIWDKNTERLIFIGGTWLYRELQKEDFRINFLYHLSQALDAGSGRFFL